MHHPDILDALAGSIQADRMEAARRLRLVRLARRSADRRPAAAAPLRLVPTREASPATIPEPRTAESKDAPGDRVA